MLPDVLALIPARAGSKRIPGKNARLLGGKVLAQWTFDAALSSQRIGKILLSTDDAELAELAKESDIAVLDRPVELAGDHATSVDVALHALDSERAAGRNWEVLCLLQPTSPFRDAGRIDEGLELLSSRPDIAAIVGAATPAHHPLHCLIENKDGHLVQVAAVDDQETTSRSQDFPSAWALTGSLYAIRNAVLREHRSFLPPACLPLACDAPGESIDIDWPQDFERAEAHLQALQARSR